MDPRLIYLLIFITSVTSNPCKYRRKRPFPHTTDCDKYFYCKYGMPNIGQCPKDYIFDIYKHRCLPPSLGRCRHKTGGKHKGISSDEFSTTPPTLPLTTPPISPCNLYIEYLLKTNRITADAAPWLKDAVVDYKDATKSDHTTKAYDRTYYGDSNNYDGTTNNDITNYDDGMTNYDHTAKNDDTTNNNETINYENITNNDNSTKNNDMINNYDTINKDITVTNDETTKTDHHKIASANKTEKAASVQHKTPNLVNIKKNKFVSFGNRAANNLIDQQTPRCEDSLLWAVPIDNCSGYYICDKGHIIKGYCSKEYRFSPTELTCLPKDDVNCSISQTSTQDRIKTVESRFNIDGLSSQKPTCAYGDKWVIPDPYSCSIYHKCYYGQILTETCPYGYSFNLEVIACLPNDEADCALPWPSCDYHDSWYAPDYTSCSNYHACYNGQITKVSCPPGFEFSQEQLTCLPEDQAKCSAPSLPVCSYHDEGLTASKDSCREYYRCYYGEILKLSCINGYEFSPTEFECLPKALAGCSQSPLPDCGYYDYWLKPIPDDCTKYYLCYDGQITENSCSDGYEFSPTSLTCLPEDQAKCSAPSLPVCSYHDEGLTASKDSCREYYRCYYGEILKLSCINGYEFSPTEFECLPKALAGCSQSPLPDCGYYDYWLKPIPDDCTKYYLCYDGQITENSCSDGYEFSPTSLECLPKALAGCSQSPLPDCGYYDYWLKPFPEDCIKYYLCYGGQITEYSCTDGYEFSPASLECLPKSLAGCSQSPLPDCGYYDYWLKPFPDECSQYYQCYGGQITEYSCSDGYEFSPTSLTCLSKEQAGCSMEPLPDCGYYDFWVQLDPDDCGSYYYCFAADVSKKQCPYGQEFCPTKLMCLPIEEAGCSTPPATSTSGTQITPFASSTTNQETTPTASSTTREQTTPSATSTTSEQTTPSVSSTTSKETTPSVSSTTIEQTTLPVSSTTSDQTTPFVSSTTSEQTTPASLSTPDGQTTPKASSSDDEPTTRYISLTTREHTTPYASSTNSDLTTPSVSSTANEQTTPSATSTTSEQITPSNSSATSEQTKPYTSSTNSDLTTPSALSTESEQPTPSDSSRTREQTTRSALSTTSEQTTPYTSSTNSDLTTPSVSPTASEQTTPSVLSTTCEQTTPSVSSTTSDQTTPSASSTASKQTTPFDSSTTRKQTSPSATSTTSEQIMPSNSSTTSEQTTPYTSSTNSDLTTPSDSSRTREQTTPSALSTTREDTTPSSSPTTSYHTTLSASSATSEQTTLSASSPSATTELTSPYASPTPGAQTTPSFPSTISEETTTPDPPAPDIQITPSVSSTPSEQTTPSASSTTGILTTPSASPPNVQTTPLTPFPTTTADPAYDCKETDVWMKPDLQECKYYYLCLKGNLMHSQCPQGNEFSPMEYSCRPKDVAGCSILPSLTMTDSNKKPPCKDSTISDNTPLADNLKNKPPGLNKEISPLGDNIRSLGLNERISPLGDNPRNRPPGFSDVISPLTDKTRTRTSGLSEEITLLADNPRIGPPELIKDPSPLADNPRNRPPRLNVEISALEDNPRNRPPGLNKAFNPLGDLRNRPSRFNKELIGPPELIKDPSPLADNPRNRPLGLNKALSPLGHNVRNRPPGFNEEISPLTDSPVKRPPGLNDGLSTHKDYRINRPPGLNEEISPFADNPRNRPPGLNDGISPLADTRNNPRNWQRGLNDGISTYGNYRRNWPPGLNKEISPLADTQKYRPPRLKEEITLSTMSANTTPNTRTTPSKMNNTLSKISTRFTSGLKCSILDTWLKPDTMDCKSFYVCLYGHLMHELCPKGHEFSVSERVCLLKADAGCSISRSLANADANPLGT